MSENSAEIGIFLGKNNTSATDLKVPSLATTPTKEPAATLNEQSASANTVQPPSAISPTTAQPPSFNEANSHSANQQTKPEFVPSGPPSVPTPTFSPLSPTAVHPNTRMQTDLMRALEQPFINPKTNPKQTIRDSDISYAAPTESIPIPNAYASGIIFTLIRCSFKYVKISFYSYTSIY